MAGVVLVPTGVGRERILTYGNEGAGKTYGGFCILDKAEGKGWYLDTDDTVIPYLDGERFSHLQDRLTFENALFEFGDALEFVEKAKADAGPDDWLFVDRVDWAWDAAQEEFSDKVFGVDIDDHLVSHRKALEDARKNDKSTKAQNPFDGFADWPVIKKRHQRFMRTIMRFPGHVYICAGEKKVDEKLDDSNIQRTYGRVGARPAGEKNNGYLVRTVLRMQGNNPQTWRATTVKDRERDQLDGVGVTDLAMDYLAKVGHWKMEVKGGE